MELNKRFYFRLSAVFLLILITVLVMIIGRGHTIYFDNKTIEYEGVEYKAFQEVCINLKNNEEQYLYPRERGMANVMGQNFKVSFDIVAKKGSMSADSYTESFSVPYGMDGVVINLPAYFAGLPEDVWMTEFVSLAKTTDGANDDILIDEFSTGAF